MIDAMGEGTDELTERGAKAVARATDGGKNQRQRERVLPRRSITHKR